MVTPEEATNVLDWTLAAACLSVTAAPRAGPVADALDNALAAHFAYLHQVAPTAHAAVLALLEPGDQLAIHAAGHKGRGGRAG